jgi:two-component system sensor histidine kinase BaeS
MRTKLFFAFFVVIATALVSNLIFEHLILRDFEEYVWSTREDQIYVLLASVESTYTEGGGWDRAALENALRWALMLGYDLKVEDASGGKVLESEEALGDVSPVMMRRIESLVELKNPEGPYEKYPLYVGGEEIGQLSVRSLSKEGFQKKKGEVFKRRGKTFLFISFLIAGGGALFLSLVFSFFLTGPLKRLKRAAEAVARGDLTARVKEGGRDEVGRLMESFNHMVEALEREETLRSHLTSNIAHELRTPLAVMRANLEAAVDGVVQYDRKKLEALLREVQRLTTLVSGIEDVTKAEASFFKPAQNERLDLRGLLEGIRQSMSPLFKDKGLELSLSDHGALEVVTDAEKLERIVRNILANSLVHTERGGAHMDYGGNEDAFFIEIRDTGRGIPREELPKIFERFYKGEGSAGIGLGLSIVKELLEVMRGDIDVKSAPGRGTSFRITLPRMEKA